MAAAWRLRKRSTTRGVRALPLLAAGLLALLACTPASEPEVVVMVGAGDIAHCDSPGDEATALLLDSTPGVVFTVGDHAYPNGTAEQFARCYEPSWGRHRARTRPAPGNHDYDQPGAGPYFDYFGQAAGERDRGYYAYRLGAWHVLALNSNCQAVGGCHAGSPQERWLREELARSRTVCTLAYWHHPLFSSGPNRPTREMEPFWQALYEAGADIVLNGHEHHYERFARMNPRGERDGSRGIRQFVLGTGGDQRYPFVADSPNSEVRNGETWGVLKLTLHPTTYVWQFLPVAGQTFADSGQGSCH